MSMFNISLPSFLTRRPAPPSSSATTAIALPPVRSHAIETSPSKPSRALKHLLKANHANHALIHNRLRSQNRTAHHLGSAHMLGAHSEQLHDIYNHAARSSEPWSDSPGEISLDDWRDHLGKREYQRAFLDFFEDQVVRLGYDWRRVVEEFLFEGDRPVVHGLVGGLGHPLVHLGYAMELGCGTVAVEALTVACCFYGSMGWHKYLEDEKYGESTERARALGMGDAGGDATPLELLQKAAKDERFGGLFSESGGDNVKELFDKREGAVLEYWNAWDLGKDAKEQFKHSQRAAVAILVASHNQNLEHAPDYNVFFCHPLTTSHAVRILLPVIDERWHGSLVRQWWLFTLAVYISQTGPTIDEKRVTDVELEGRDWNWVVKTSLTGKRSLDVHFVKACRAIQEAAETWGDEDGFYLKAAVKFAGDFDGWGGIGAADEAIEELELRG